MSCASRGCWSPRAGVRSIWSRHGLERFRKRLALSEEKAAKEGIVYTEAQLVALEAAKRERETNPDEIETAHPGYLLSQDTFYVGYLKGVGRIYQQPAVDTYSSVSFAKVYTAKVPVTAADLLNDRVLPFFDHYDVPLDPRQAIRDFDKALELDPCDASGYIFRGVTYSNDFEDHFQRAINDYKNAARLGEKGVQKMLQKMGIAW